VAHAVAARRGMFESDAGAQQRGSFRRSLGSEFWTGIGTHRMQTPPVCPVLSPRATMRLGGRLFDLKGAIQAPTRTCRRRRSPSRRGAPLRMPSHTVCAERGPRSTTCLRGRTHPTPTCWGRKEGIPQAVVVFRLFQRLGKGRCDHLWRTSVDRVSSRAAGPKPRAGTRGYR
jgi:hypothetical protein